MTKRTLLIARLKILSFLGKNHSKASLLRKSGLFKEYGEGGYWHPDWIPSYPEYISIGNNVTVAADVRFYEHDMIHRMWNGDPTFNGPGMRVKKGNISVGDNSVLGARSIILYGVEIGRNVVVASGSVVTKNVQDYAIVAGCPARVIGDTRELLRRRLEYEGLKIDEESYSYESYFSLKD